MIYGNPVWDAKNPKVPVDQHGNWLSYPTYQHTHWETVQPFFAVLEMDGMQTGRSSKLFILKDVETGKEYPMFVADLMRGIQDKALRVHDGKLSAMWTASKRGANYGIKALK
jgi:hypothetical protein